MKNRFLTNTFSPMMLTPNDGSVFMGEEVSLETAKKSLNKGFKSAVSHEITALVLATLLETDVPFNRVNLMLRPGDEVVCIVPNFRATEAREFTRDEVVGAGFRCFIISLFN